MGVNIQIALNSNENDKPFLLVVIALAGTDFMFQQWEMISRYQERLVLLVLLLQLPLANM